MTTYTINTLADSTGAADSPSYGEVASTTFAVYVVDSGNATKSTLIATTAATSLQAISSSAATVLATDKYKFVLTVNSVGGDSAVVSWVAPAFGSAGDIPSGTITPNFSAQGLDVDEWWYYVRATLNSVVAAAPFVAIVDGACAQTLGMTQGAAHAFTGPWLYDITGASAVSGAVAQVLGFSQAAEGYTPYRDGAVAQTLGLGQTAAGIIPNTSGPWAYDLRGQVNVTDGACAQTFGLTQAMDMWTRIADLPANANFLDDYTAVPGETYLYRVTSHTGAVLGTWLYSEPVTMPSAAIFDGTVAQTLGLAQSAAGETTTRDGACAQTLGLTQGASGMVGITDGSCAQTLDLSQSMSALMSGIAGQVDAIFGMTQSIVGVVGEVDGATGPTLGLTQRVSGVMYDPATPPIEPQHTRPGSATGGTFRPRATALPFRPRT